MSHLTDVSMPVLGMGRHAWVPSRHLRSRIQVQVSTVHSRGPWWGVWWAWSVEVMDKVGEGVTQRCFSPVMPFHTPVHLSESIFSLIISMTIFHSCGSYMSFSNLKFLLYPSVSLTRHALSPPCKTIYFITSVTVSHHLNSKFISASSVQWLFW